MSHFNLNVCSKFDLCQAAKKSKSRYFCLKWNKNKNIQFLLLGNLPHLDVSMINIGKLMRFVVILTNWFIDYWKKNIIFCKNYYSINRTSRHLSFFPIWYSLVRILLMKYTTISIDCWNNTGKIIHARGWVFHFHPPPLSQQNLTPDRMGISREKCGRIFEGRKFFQFAKVFRRTFIPPLALSTWRM